MHDPIVEEVHESRRKLVVECGGSLQSLMRRLKDLERLHPDRIVTTEDVQRRKRERAAQADPVVSET